MWLVGATQLRRQWRVARKRRDDRRSRDRRGATRAEKTDEGGVPRAELEQLLAPHERARDGDSVWRLPSAAMRMSARAQRAFNDSLDERREVIVGNWRD